MIFILAACMGISALSIDLLLPAFPAMRADLGLPAESTRISLIITTYFLGLGLGQILYGPASDRFGRKPAMYTGLALYVAATTAAMFAPTLETLIVLRFAWGLGAAAPRSLALAVARDVYSGDALARAMSLIMAIYIVVPVVAPLAGSGLLAIGSWRWIIAVQMLIGLGIIVALRRLPETLALENRRAISIGPLLGAAGVVLRCRPAVGYGLAVTAVYGIMISYIGGIEVLITEVFGHGDRFAYLFAAVALGLVSGSLFAARFVGRVGTARLVRGAMGLLGVASIGLALSARFHDGHPNTAVFLTLMCLVLFCCTVIIPSANAAALEPLGKVAGMAAGIIGVVSTVGAALLGALTDRSFDGTATPFTDHVLVYACIGAVAIFAIAPSSDRGTRPVNLT